MSKTTQKATAGLNAPAAKAAMDPDLNTLFASSLGPVVASSGFRRSNRAAEAARSNEEEKEESTSQDFSDTDEVAPQPFGSSLGKFDEEVPEFHSRDALLAQSARSTVTNEASPSKKRRRATQDAEVEDLYMQRLAREDFKEDSQRKKQKSSTGNPASVPADRATGEENVDTAICGPPVPQHEVLGPDTEGEAIDKAARTVFLGNVSSDAITSSRARRVLQKHLASFLPSLDHHDPPHKVETLRFRSTAFSSPLPKKAAFAKKNIMDATTKGTNAYALYSTQMAAREAPRQLNGKVVLNRHLRVDSVAHPAKVDHRRCVFVGNLDYFDDESPHVKEQRQRRKQPGDVEEGLWVHFSNAGQVENVRVIRDAQTRAGKGFAYVQFADQNGVEAALQYDDRSFPPLLPRKLRVTRAKARTRKPGNPKSLSETRERSDAQAIDTTKAAQALKSFRGRAGHMLGKAGAAQLGPDEQQRSVPTQSADSKRVNSFVFEGHRATNSQGTSGSKIGSRKKGSKPKTRSSKRGAAWKALGRKH